MNIHGPIDRPSFEPLEKPAKTYKHYGSLAVILTGVLIVTPAWIALLVWLGLRLTDWLLV